jgi:hypothetical protein
MNERLFFMKTFTTGTAEGLFELKPQDVSECLIDAVELTDEDLENVSGSCFGCGWGGGFFPGFWGGGFFPSFWGGGFFPGFWGGGFARSFAFSGFGGWW